jgi:hypothetical protein
MIISTKERHQRAAGGACAINSSANPAPDTYFHRLRNANEPIYANFCGVSRDFHAARRLFIYSAGHLERERWLARHEKRVRGQIWGDPFTQKSEQIKRVAALSTSYRHFKLFAVNCRATAFLFLHALTYIYFECMYVWQAPATRMQYSQSERRPQKRDSSWEHSLGRGRRRSSSTWPLIYIHTYMRMYGEKKEPPTRLTAGGWKIRSCRFHSPMCVCVNRNRSSPDMQI